MSKFVKRPTVSILVLALASQAALPTTAIAGGNGKGWSTGTKVLAGAGAVAAGYLLYRAYRNSRDAAAARYAPPAPPARYGSRYYDSSDYSAAPPPEAESSSDAEYQEWKEKQSAAELKAAADKAYKEQLAENAIRFSALKSRLDADIERLKKGSEANWLCVSLCGRYQGATLVASLVDSEAATADSANKAITGKCRNPGYLFTEIAPAAKKHELTFNPSACFPNRVSVPGMVQESLANGATKITMITNDVVVIDDGKTVTPKFLREALNTAHNAVKAIESVGGNAKAATEKALAEGEKSDPDFDKKVASLHPIVKLSRPGHVVLGNEDKNPLDRIEIVADTVGPGAILETMTTAVVISHACGDETHVVKFKIYLLMGPAANNDKYGETHHLMRDYQDAVDTSDAGETDYCSKPSDGAPAKLELRLTTAPTAQAPK